MPRLRRDDSPSLLTAAELELMSILWRLDGGTVRDVMDQLPPERDLAYTSVSTILRILDQKGFVRTRKEGRTHHYLPAITRSRYEERNVSHLVGGLFGGDPLSLLRRLISSAEVSSDDLREMQQLVEEQLTE